MESAEAELEPAESVEAEREPARPMELSVILPARNEERSLPECLASLLAQSERGFALGAQWELLIIDDDSSDQTGSIAAEASQAYPGVRVLKAPPLDQSDRGGFTGKNNACWAGAQQAQGRWLLFTDADTIHEPGDLSRAIHEAEKYKVALLSYSPRQIVTGFWQRAVMPLVFSELSSVYPPKEVNDPTRRIAAANGQFILVEREAYFAVGGHRGVGLEVLEDVALANRIKRSTSKIRFRYAPDALSTRMYRTLPEMIEGWTKNLALLFPRPVNLALWRILDVGLYFGIPWLALTMPYLQTWQRGVLLLIWLRTLWRFYGRVGRSNFPAVDCAISILGVPLFVYLLVRSFIDHRINKRVHWKGRTYSTGRPG
jgi:glycosyltransferase involved in cell wall biosynthesis